MALQMTGTTKTQRGVSGVVSSRTPTVKMVVGHGSPNVGEAG